MNTDFASLQLPDALFGNLASLGYEQMRPVQAAVLPDILLGLDVIAQAKTGSGKTAAFGLGMLSRLNLGRTQVEALVLCPTRELAEQTTGELRRLSRALPNVRILSLCGGTQFGPQRSSLQHGVDVVVGTPGRVLEHLEKGSLELAGLRVVVLDEADRMLDMGFKASIAAILEHAPAQRQTLLFSATYNDEVRALSRGYQREPKEITVDTETTARDIDERFFEIQEGGAEGAVLSLLAEHQPESTLVFCNFKASCQKLVDSLLAAGISAAALHGDMEQFDRDHVLLLFANKSCSVLVATDVAARGLDIKELSLVINFELSPDPDVHHHRVGRTGRADHRGMAFTLFTARSVERVRAIELHAKRKLRIDGLPPRVQGRVRLLAPMATIQIAGGRRDKLRPTDILGALTSEGGVPGEAVGKIDVRPAETYVAIARDRVPAALSVLGAGRIKGRSFKARLAKLATAR
ncbi:MAG TPA: ATP-dependent RNA helicase DbpA [Polyangiaceae bacterium]|nr:ATP-dependent RNA helicase DbpA [Polyangiaceae bacterium]